MMDYTEIEIEGMKEILRDKEKEIKKLNEFKTKREESMFYFKAQMENGSYGTELGLAYVLKTLEGKTIIREGDYLVIGTKGEFYPCKKDIFENKYVKSDF